ncbi:MAG: efflux RND transporter periplasmic adaptor subunit [Minisyncoccia bacterium]
MENNNIFKKPWVRSLISFVVIFVLLGGFLFWQTEKNTVFIENSDLEAPIINLSPTAPGVLNALYVKDGDRVPDNTPVALVGSQIISTQAGGIVTDAPNVLGSYFSPGQTVVSVVNFAEMKVVGQIEETKGLNKIKTGERATFSVDAFPGKTYEGVVDEISAVSDDTGVVFDISDQRPVKKFDIKVRFNVADYPELKSGMSAKITVYTD